MAFVRQNVNLDPRQLKLAQRLARESGSAFSAYVREALERHNTATSVVSVLENANAQLERLIDDLREENALFRSALQEDLRRLRDETKAEQDSAIQRYEEALRKVVTAALSQPSPKGSGAAKVPAAGPMTAPRT
ncbi:hypothetical protein CR156_03625 [Stenotrophomonas lactitubi]|uniref:hypothetical protein n=1 Tax=Stenotrophomonas TaxID=40323 RepID=UPI00066AE05B|nr:MULTISPECIES: hypothetical protein [Stenotrophomonas]AWB78935.1 hypothetical protein B7H26_13780 [Stenotrophomonas maltophilia]ELK2665697.1 hypothetical protein [Stenotrophomonas maltophilia]MBA0435048.1 hypothetical protein [Stenotrophomonas maltophilia]MBH1493371.1 hypothetical protein [Stenotrophomonas maltophilia]MBH1585062.1 hypothetical protein [Stenotrophomonas maltophilia]